VSALLSLQLSQTAITKFPAHKILVGGSDGVFTDDVKTRYFRTLVFRKSRSLRSQQVKPSKPSLVNIEEWSLTASARVARLGDRLGKAVAAETNALPFLAKRTLLLLERSGDPLLKQRLRGILGRATKGACSRQRNRLRGVRIPWNQNATLLGRPTPRTAKRGPSAILKLLAQWRGQARD
jgi:hypothetical protein